MNTIILLITFLVNFLFMMLTTLLPILVFDITNSASSVGLVLTIFMISLLTIRIICLRIILDSKKSLLFGSILFFIGFLMVNMDKNNFMFFCLGAVFFGIAIGLVPPALLTILTNSEQFIEKTIGTYNSIVAIASIISPLIGETLFHFSLNILYFSWLIGALVMLCLSIAIVKFINKKPNNTKKLSDTRMSNVFKLGKFRTIFLVLLLTSISYGTIISYLPLLLSSKNISIGGYYLFFWGAYILAQYANAYLMKKISRNLLICIMLVGLSISMLVVSFSGSGIIYFSSGIMYGFCNGALYNLFYYESSQLSNEKLKNDAYAVIGLMSYIGVGLTPTILNPVLSIINDLQWIFTFSVIFIVFSIGIYVFSIRKGFVHGYDEKRNK